MISIPTQDFAGEDGTAEAVMITSSLGNVKHVGRLEDEACNEGHRV